MSDNFDNVCEDESISEPYEDQSIQDNEPDDEDERFQDNEPDADGEDDVHSFSEDQSIEDDDSAYNFNENTNQDDDEYDVSSETNAEREKRLKYDYQKYDEDRVKKREYLNYSLLQKMLDDGTHKGRKSTDKLKRDQYIENHISRVLSKKIAIRFISDADKRHARVNILFQEHKTFLVIFESKLLKITILSMPTRVTHRVLL